MVKSYEKKMSKLFSYVGVVNVAEIWNLERWILRFTQEKMMGFDYCEEYLRITSNKILLRQC